MRLLKRNKTEFQYRAYKDRTEIIRDGRHTGRYTVVYEAPATLQGNISAPSGYVGPKWFGTEQDYTHVLLMDKPWPVITENGLVDWHDRTYRIQQVRETPDFLAVALMQLVVDHTQSNASADADTQDGADG